MEFADSLIGSCVLVVERIAGTLQKAAMRTLQNTRRPLSLHNVGVQPVVILCLDKRREFQAWLYVCQDRNEHEDFFEHVSLE